MGAIKSPKCTLGHKMSDPNLYYRSDGKRECLTCKNRRNRDSNLARKKSRLDKPKPARKPRAKERGGQIKPSKPSLKKMIIERGGE
jgi:hypothetical protein